MRAFLAPLRCKFEHPDDVKLYGDDWYVYDEYQIVNLPVRRLIELESAMGTTMVDVFNGMRLSSALGDLCSAWLAVKLSEHPDVLPKDFSDFSPYTMQMTWEAAPEGKAHSSDPVPEPPPAISLPTLPVVESPT